MENTMSVPIKPPIQWCAPCLQRGRRTQASIKLGSEWWCNGCRLGFDSGRCKCKLCGAILRSGNESGYCSNCSKSGAAAEAEKRLRSSLTLVERVVGQVVRSGD